MLSNMASSLIEHKRITTTVAKAKALRKFVEPLINRSKEDSTHSRRIVFRYLGNKNAVTELFREVAPKVSEREGGYTRIIKTGYRLGDAAEMCIIELVDFNELYSNDQKKGRTRRSRRGGAKKKGSQDQSSGTTKAESAEGGEVKGSVATEDEKTSEVKNVSTDAPEVKTPQKEEPKAEGDSKDDASTDGDDNENKEK